ncbi:MAG: hypothetical protein IPG72_09215 [Ardenticatenales bacterium]|nr:hypothetical protein [Ardenticatenales bacterium]
MQRTVIGAGLLATAFAAGVTLSAASAPNARAARGGPSTQSALPVEQAAPAAPPAEDLARSGAAANARRRFEDAADDFNADGTLTAEALAQVAGERAEILEWMDDFIEAQELVAPQPDTGSVDRLRDLRARIAVMPDEHLHRLRIGMGDDPGFWQLFDMLKSILLPGSQPVPPHYVDAIAASYDVPEGVTYSRRPQRYAIAPGLIGGPPVQRLPVAPGGFQPDAVVTPDATQTVPYPLRTPFPTREALPPVESRPGCTGAYTDNNICEECPDAVPLGAVFAAKLAAIIAGGLNDASGTSSQDICAPPGVGFTVPNFVKYIFIGIAAAAEEVVNGLEAANKVAEDCREAYAQAVANTQLDETISSRVSQASFDLHADTEMRLAIEHNLLRGADENIGLFILPFHRCGSLMPQADVEQRFRFCGKLELVREVVADAIDRNNAAGGTVDVNNARLELVAGDMHYMNSQWRSAYARYRAAYIRVVQQSSTP